MKKVIYLDYNATTPMRDEARAAMMAAMDAPHNASAVHGYGRAGRSIVEKARDQVADALGIPAGQVIFNSGATEANNTVLRYFKTEYPDQPILVSAIEHLSVLEALDDLIHIPVTRDGIVDLKALEALLQTHKPSLVSVMLVNNETGVIQPITEVSALARKYGAMVHCDGVQALGRIPINLNALGVDFMSVSAHKIGGPQGVGALALGLCGITPTLLQGGGQEKKARAGTENVAGIAGFGAATERTIRDPTPPQTTEEKRQKIETKLIDYKNIIIHGQKASRVPNTVMFSLPGTSAETMMMAFDLEGFAVSNGSACSSGTVRSSYVLEAMGFDKDISTSALRVSIGWNTTEAEIDAFLATWDKIYARIAPSV